MKNLLMLVCFVMAGIAGCNSSRNMAKLNDVKWVLQEMNGKTVELTDKNSEVYIQFNEAEKRVNGRGGCNRFFGNYEMDGSKLKFLPLGATRMACPDLQVENEFFKMLDTVDSYAIKDNTLYFKSKGEIVATFKMQEEKDKKQN